MRNIQGVEKQQRKLLVFTRALFGGGVFFSKAQTTFFSEEKSIIHGV